MQLQCTYKIVFCPLISAIKHERARQIVSQFPLIIIYGYTAVHEQVSYLVCLSLPLCPVTPDGKPGSAKKRRKSMSSGLAQGKTGSPSTSFNPAAMTERQQMAYLLQMTDPHKKTGESPHPAQV